MKDNLPVTVMDDITVTASRPTQSEKAAPAFNPSNPQDYNLEYLILNTSKGDWDLKPLLVEFSYYEDIFSFVVSGSLTIRDALGYISYFQLDGTEILNISLGKFEDGPKIDLALRVYKVDNRKSVGNMTSEYYTLHFCSEELILSEQSKISKSFDGVEISKIITNILNDKNDGFNINDSKKTFGGNSKKIDIEETQGVYNFALGYMKPFEAISYVSMYARPVNGVGADMLFYETKDGFKFKSLQTLYKQDAYRNYTYNPKNTDESFFKKLTNVITYEIVKPFDMLNEINAGTFANRLISLDPLTRTKTITDYNYTKDDGKMLNTNVPVYSPKNRLGNQVEMSPLSNIKVAMSNAGRKDVTYIKENDTIELGGKDIFIETWGPHRLSQLNLMNFTTVKISVAGDPALTVGQTIFFNIYNLAQSTGSPADLDKYYSGKYLITAVRHVIQSPETYQTILEISKDSTLVAQTTGEVGAL
jgi:hypothetical protein